MQRSKNVSGLLMILALLFFVHCATSESPLEKPVVLEAGHTASFADGVSVTFTRLVSDSRCPAGVQCIQKGQAIVELQCIQRSETKVIRLSTDPPGNQSEVFGYRIELLGVASPAASATIRLSR